MQELTVHLEGRVADTPQPQGGGVLATQSVFSGPEAVTSLRGLLEMQNLGPLPNQQHTNLNFNTF